MYQAKHNKVKKLSKIYIPTHRIVILKLKKDILSRQKVGMSL